MSTVAVVTDSCASIPEPMIQAFDIRWVPYCIHRGKDVLSDLITSKSRSDGWARSKSPMCTLQRKKR